MLKPTILAFINFFFIDAYLLNVLFVGATVAWDWNTIEERYNENSTRLIVSLAVQTVVGALLAQPFRYVQGRGALTFERLYSVIQMVNIAAIILAAILMAILTDYDSVIQDPPQSFAKPFPVGLLRAVLCVVLFLGVVEVYQDSVMAATPTKLSASGKDFTMNSDNLIAAVVIMLVAALDLMAFEHGWAIGLMILAFYLVAVVGSSLFNRVMAI